MPDNSTLSFSRLREQVLDKELDSLSKAVACSPSRLRASESLVEAACRVRRLDKVLVLEHSPGVSGCCQPIPGGKGAFLSCRGLGGRWLMERMKKLLMPQGWMSGLCGRPGEDGRSVGRAKLSARLLFFLLSLVFCMGALLPPSLAHSALWRVTDLLCCS